MSRKKVIFVIVEGPSDETALGAILSKIFDRNNVYLHIMREDITTKNGVNVSNILSRIGNIVKQYAKDNHFSKSNFQEIIHLVDMDGAYIPDESVIEDLSAERPVYSLSAIHTANREGIVSRNEQKRKNIDKLCGCSQIWSLPYQVYFMSCNLDHVLYNKLNSTDTEKEDDSYKFAYRYKNNTAEFITYISESAFSLTEGYKESWNYIKDGLHSLERHTNFGLCFQELVNDKEKV